MRNLYLVGMMGSGKSVTGKKLAEYLGYSFLDLDEYIQQKAQRKITEIFEKDGEDFFRDLEASALVEAARGESRVVATGGGTILRSGNVERMKTTGKIVFLDTSVEYFWERVKYKKDRTLLKDASPREKLMRIYADRMPIYKRVSDVSINTDGETADTAARKIISVLDFR